MNRPQGKANVLDRSRLDTSVIDALHVGVIVVDLSGRVVEMNREAASLLELPLPASRDRFWADLLPPAGVVTAVAEKTFRERRGVPDMTGPLHGEVGSRTAMCGSAPMRDASGATRGFVIEFRDVTGVARMEQEVRQLDRLATIGRFAAAIAHEIRNPLTGIYAGVQFLERTLPPGSEQQATTYRIVREEVERLNRIVEDMLGSARTPEPRLEETDPSEVAGKAHLLLLEEGRRHSVRVTLRCDETLPPIRLDGDLIVQVLLNLGRNAVEASPAGGEVVLETAVSLGSPSHGPLPCSGSAPGVAFRVRDQGPGIAPGEREHIFEPFRTSKKRGTGLGLYVSFQIMEKHGGTLWVRTEVGKGAEFTAWVPYRSAAEGGRGAGPTG
jgi:signal transduction histidine kinase